MRQAACKGCGSAFDVSRMAPGTVFVCGACGAQLKVPGAAPPAARRGPPGRAEFSSTSRHSAERSSTSRRRGARPERAARSPVPILLGVGGLVVVLIVVGIVLAVPGSPDEGPVIPTAGNPAATQPPAKTKAQRIKEIETALLAALSQKRTGSLQEIHSKAIALRAPSTARKAAEAALKLDSDLEWAHEAVGHVKYAGEKLPDDDEVLYPTPDYKLLMEALRESWLTTQRQKEVVQAEGRFLAHMKKIEEDPHYRKVCHWKGSIRKHPVFQEYDYVTVEARPYLLFVQKSGNKRKDEKLRARAEEKGKLFRCLYDTFLATYGERFKLPRLESDDYAKDTILKAWVFADRKSFNKYHESIKRPVGDNVGAYYNPSDQWIVIPDGVANMGRNPPGQSMDVNVSVHEGTHQLIHHWTKRLVEDEAGEEVPWTDRRLSSRSHWFQEGVAEFFGSVVEKGESWALFQRNLYRIGPWKSLRAQKRQEWEFGDMVKISNSGQLNRGPPWMGGLFYGQAWAFVSFLNNFEDGKYREKFLEYMESELHGRSGYPTLLKVFGIKKVEGTELEKDFEKWCENLLK